MCFPGEAMFAFNTALKIEKVKAPLNPPPPPPRERGYDCFRLLLLNEDESDVNGLEGNKKQCLQEKIVPITLRVASSLCCFPCTDKILSGDAPTL